MILMASLICVFALFVICCAHFVELFCVFSQFLWLNLTKNRSYWFRNDF